MYHLEFSLYSRFIFIARHELVRKRELNRLSLHSRPSPASGPQADVVAHDLRAARGEQRGLERRAPLKDAPRGAVVDGELPLVRLESTAKNDSPVRPWDDVSRLALLQILACEQRECVNRGC